VRVRHPADEAAAFKRVEHRGHAAGRDDESLCDDARFERFASAFEDGECVLGGA